MKKTLIVIMPLLFTINLLSADLLTVAELSDYKKTSMYKDVIEFIFEAQKRSDKIKILKFTTSTEGRMVPLVVISSENIGSAYEQKISGKPCILIMANIHAGEIEGKEATLMLIRDFVENKLNNLIKRQIVLIIPIFNADGNEKLSKNNRRDNGPELAGVRYNGQNLDLNRDYVKLESPEIISLVKLFNQWDPVLTVDMHTTNGSYHREPVTYTPQANPNTEKTLRDYMWKKFFPEVSKILKKKYGYDSVPYGNFVDRANPEKGWRNHAYSARYGNNYVGLRNRFAVLDENYAHADFKTRVLSSYSFIKAILQFTEKNIKEMQELVRKADTNTRMSFFKNNHILEYKTEKLFDLKIKSYEFVKEKIKPEDKHKYPPWIKDFIVKKTNVNKDYKVSYFAKAVPTRHIELRQGYIILPPHKNIMDNLKAHGIIIEKIRKDFIARVEMFKLESVEISKRMYQGHVPIDLKGKYVEVEKKIPQNSFFVSMKQPLARLIAELLEPESQDSLAKWGFLNRVIVRQWSNRPGIYPIFRINENEYTFEKYQE